MADSPDVETSMDSTTLTECRKMDKRLAKVASATFGSIEGKLLDGIFQYVDFFQLLTIRRVCLQWKSRISKKSAPFLKLVGISLYPELLGNPSKLDRMRKEANVWQFAKKASVVLLFEDLPKTQTQRRNWAMGSIWSAYKEQVATDGRTRLVEKVMYVDTIVYAGLLEHEVLARSGVETVLVNTSLELNVCDLWSYELDESSLYKWSMDYKELPLTVEVRNRVSYTMTESDVVKKQRAVTVDSDRTSEAISHLVLGSLEPLQKKAATKLIKTVKEFAAKKVLLDFVKALLERFDTGNKGSLKLYQKGDVQGFLDATSPVVGFLLQNFLQELDYYIKRAQRKMGPRGGW